MSKYCLTITCPSRRGIVAAISGFLTEKGCTITDSAQFDDANTERFFTRLSLVSEAGAEQAELEAEFASIAQEFDMEWGFHGEDEKMKVLIMVSRYGHCLTDLLYRSQIGTLPIEVVGVVSNHLDYQKLVVNNDIPFHHINVTKENKVEAEAKLLALVEDSGAELVILARYMQILSDTLCQKMSGRIINIHHSFLPSFKGANPYKQAFDKGVKLIGATSHYVTADLDEGPIIEQETTRVTHAQSIQDYVSFGREVEASVLARAVHAHVRRRVFQNGDKTVVFPASPGSYSAQRMG